MRLGPKTKTLHIRTAGTDTWLTPPELITALGLFDLDPCCPREMPWTTATRMLHFPVTDGLKEPWQGRVWCNPPYSDVNPWADKMIAHNNGIMLVGGKSTDAKWCQKLLAASQGAYFLKGRLLFHYENGAKSDGKWMPNLLFAFGKYNYNQLLRLPGQGFPGVLMTQEQIQ